MSAAAGDAPRPPDGARCPRTAAPAARLGLRPSLHARADPVVSPGSTTKP